MNSKIPLSLNVILEDVYPSRGVRMVRTYVRKSARATKYSKSDLKTAVEKIVAGTLTYTAASTMYNIPRPTLYAHSKGSRGMKSNSMGRATVLSPDIEHRLSESLKIMEKYGYGLSRREVLDLVGDFLKTNKIKNSFSKGIPGEDWWLGFARRNNLSIKKPQIVEYSRKKVCDPFIIYNYFDILHKTIKELNLENKPDRIWNLDETSFCLDPSKTKCVGAKGVACTRTTFGSGRENTSVLMACSAAGDKGPPLIIFKGKNIWDKWIGSESLFPGTIYAATNNGWMEKEVFVNYFHKSFIKTTNPSPQNPILLIYDGLSSHINIQLVEIARANNVTILLLPPHSSHLLQPMDLSVFKSIKTSYGLEHGLEIINIKNYLDKN
ncbi:jerky protein-like [Acyrthosiphon pisum]|uniref:DDE-1 domain-containing protein n=1 Tax=Acyrthosiphon pisum TaxID=7029 RepID=A0A8R2JV87_ACYPI|nr:jerky protein-like [Acyrthosiphon pisum]